MTLNRTRTHRTLEREPGRIKRVVDEIFWDVSVRVGFSDRKEISAFRESPALFGFGNQAVVEASEMGHGISVPNAIDHSAAS